jgi:hypothetical protein
MPGKPVDKIVLAPVRLVCDNHNVPPVRQEREPGFITCWEKLVNCGKDYPARSDLQEFA